MNRTSLRKIYFLLATTLITASLTWAQELTTGGIVGMVRDESAAVVPGASISVTNKATGAQRTALSSERGDFSIPGLLPALYDLRVEMPGFRAYMVQGLELKINQVARLEVRLGVGQLTESVTVSGGAVLLETESSAVGQVIDEQRVRELPLNGRNLTHLAARYRRAFRRNHSSEVHSLEAAINMSRLKGVATHPQII